MKLKVLYKLAWKNLVKNKNFTVPFVVSSGIMMSLFFIVETLLYNRFVTETFSSLPRFFSIIAVIIAVLTVVFILYANRFLTSRRSKEFALYSILGLDKKHVAIIIFFEQAILYVALLIFTLGGYVWGKLVYISLNKFLVTSGVSIGDYNFEPQAFVASFYILSATFAVMFVMSVAKVSLLTPITLLSSSKRQIKTPKVNILLLILGILSLGAGYYMALTVKGVLAAVLLFFIAALLVIAGTYMLFVSLSIFVLKVLKRSKKIYHKPVNFLTISSMIFRMRSNAVALATITVLYTAVILSLTTTLSISNVLSQTTQNLMSGDYGITESLNITDKSQEKDDILEVRKQFLADAQKLTAEINEKTKENFKVVDPIYTDRFGVQVVIENNEIATVPKNLRTSINAIPTFLYVDLLSDYNATMHTNYKLKQGQILVDEKDKEKFTGDFKLMGKKADYKYVPMKKRSTNAEYVHIVVKAPEDIEQIYSYYGKGTHYVTLMSWQVEPKSLQDKYETAFVKMIQDKTQMWLISKQDDTRAIYELFGGFIFLGIMVAIVFLTGSILVIYYKQLSEGYEDAKRYMIMRQVGLDAKLIAKTSGIQIIWILFLPLLVACVHSVFASKILHSLLQIFGNISYYDFICNFALILSVFCVVYIVIFIITSKVYRSVINQS